MSPPEARRVVASERSDEILKIENGPIRRPFSNEAVVKISTLSLNRGELRRAEKASDGLLQIGWDFVGTVDTKAADGSGLEVGTRVVGFSTRMEGWSEYREKQAWADAKNNDPELHATEQQKREVAEDGNTYRHNSGRQERSGVSVPIGELP